jgi:predicted amidohydrolase
MQDLKIALIQAALVWEDPVANLTLLQAQIAQVASGTQLIVLPEMFTTGFSMRPEKLAQPMDGPAVAWLQAQSRLTGADITGSLIIDVDGRYHNRLIWAKPDGALLHYDKKHLFRYVGEEKVYASGQEHLLVTCHGWKIRPFICYDLRFPIWTRNLNHAYDAAIFVANWPEGRASHWKVLLKARAIENQCYVAGVNRVGVDGNGHRYAGDTRIIDPKGRLVTAGGQETSIVEALLSAAMLSDYRQAFPAWMDADADMLK